MIDSIHIRLNNIQKYPMLLNHLLQNANEKKFKAEGEVSDNKHMLNFNLKYSTFTIKNKVLYDVKGEKLTSSHYTLSYHLPLGGKLGYCDFNFSIPKLLYGTNIVQFVPHKTEGRILTDMELFENYKANQEATYERLVTFIRRFFEKYFVVSEQKVSLRDVEIRRFDICWNQYFNSKREALEYLNYQKNVKKKHLKINSKNQKEYASSVFFSTKDYGCKIYHKGTEYRSKSGEKQKHLEANKQIDQYTDRLFPKKRRVKYDVEKLGAHADRILRYEITFRDSYISKIFWNKCFRRHNEAWQKRMRRFKECKRIYDFAFGKSNKDKEKSRFFYHVWQGEVNLNDKETQSYISHYFYDFKIINLKLGLTKTDRQFTMWWSKQRQRRLSFRMSVSDEILDIHAGLAKTVDMGDGIETKLPIKAKFSKTLLRKCFKIFNDFRDHFEIKEKTYLSDVVRRVDLYNDEVEKFNQYASTLDKPEKKKLRLGKAKSILLHLQSGYSLDKLVAKGICDRTTAWRWEKKFKAVNINMHTGSEVSIWNCREFIEYHRSLTHEGLEKYLINNIFF